MLNREYYEQVNVVKYMSLTYPCALYCASAGGMRTGIATAKKMKNMGYVKGCPDLMIFEPRNTYKGLFVEMKAPAIRGYAAKGSPSPEQTDWQIKLNTRGYLACICYGFDEAKAVIDKYLRGEIE